MSLFLGLGAAALLGLPHMLPLAAATGFLALFAIDRLYRVALRVGPWNLHSAHTLLNGAYLLGLLAGLGPLALAMGLMKGFLYLHRKRHFAQQGRSIRPLVGALRLAVGMLGPALLHAEVAKHLEK